MRGRSTRWPRSPTGCCPGSAEGQVLPAPGCRWSGRDFYLEQGASCVVIKDGGERRERLTAEGRDAAPPVFPVQVVDTVGAGDGFAAGLISGTSRRPRTCRGCLRRAAAVGALATTSPGDRDGLPNRAELSTSCRSSRPRRRWPGWRDDATLQIALGPDPARAPPVDITRSVAPTGGLDRGRHVAGQAVRVAGLAQVVDAAGGTPVLADLKTADDARTSSRWPTTPVPPSVTVLGLAADVTLDTAVRIADERGRRGGRRPHGAAAGPPGRAGRAAAGARRAGRARRQGRPERRACARSTCSAPGPTAGGWRWRADSPLPTCPRSRIWRRPGDRRLGRDPGRRPRGRRAGAARRGPPGQGAHVDDLIDPDLIDTVLQEMTTVLARVSPGRGAEPGRPAERRAAVFVTGEGRSGFMAKAFAMRLMHLGLPVHVDRRDHDAVGRVGTMSLVAVSGRARRAARSASPNRRPRSARRCRPSPPTRTPPLARRRRRPDRARGDEVPPRRARRATIQPLSSLFDQATHVALDVGVPGAGGPARRGQRRGPRRARQHRVTAHMERTRRWVSRTTQRRVRSLPSGCFGGGQDSARNRRSRRLLATTNTELERHRRAGDHRVEQPGGGQRQRGDVVGERPEQVALDRAQGAGATAGSASAAARRSPRTSVRSLASIATSVPVPMREPEVGLGQRGGVVDAVADHRDDPALGLQPLRRRRPCPAGSTSATTSSSMPTSRGHGPRRRRVVAGEQHRAQPEGAQPGDRLGARSA